MDRHPRPAQPRLHMHQSKVTPPHLCMVVSTPRRELARCHDYSWPIVWSNTYGLDESGVASLMHDLRIQQEKTRRRFTACAVDDRSPTTRPYRRHSLGSDRSRMPKPVGNLRKDRLDPQSSPVRCAEHLSAAADVTILVVTRHP
jgi:hypothetical protein